VRLEGEGAYSDHFSLNLIVVGDVENDFIGFTLDDLSSEMLKSFRRYYSSKTSESVTIDTLYVSFAHQHPSLGKKYPANEPWIAGYSSEDDMLSELGGWPGIEKALDIVLVHYINADQVLGFSSLFSGEMGGGEGSTVILGAFMKTTYGNEEPVPMNEIVETAIHETAHFFGLRHTTSTTADIRSLYDDYDYGDYSNLEDGLEDTPYCPQLQRSGLVKSMSSDMKMYRMSNKSLATSNVASFSVDRCPDYDNFMFPVIGNGVKYHFTAQQQAILRANLMLFPH
jgi:hypothetical protein